MTCVLVVDGNRNIREFCKRELEREGYRVVLARSSKDAVPGLRTQRPDVAVIDASAYASGTATLGVVLAAASIPVILHTLDTCREEGLGAGVSDCVQKSGDLRALMAAIDRLARRPGATRASSRYLPAKDRSTLGSRKP
jgi:DNA-binding response OmpR family regulator